jgi:hypothetical protein
MFGFIGTSIQLQSIITAHTSKSCLTTSVWWMPPEESLTAAWISDWSLLVLSLSLSLSLMLRPTVSRPVSLGIKHPPGAYDQIFIIVIEIRVCCIQASGISSQYVKRFIYRPIFNSLLWVIMNKSLDIDCLFSNSHIARLLTNLNRYSKQLRESVYTCISQRNSWFKHVIYNTFSQTCLLSVYCLDLKSRYVFLVSYLSFLASLFRDTATEVYGPN